MARWGVRGLLGVVALLTMTFGALLGGAELVVPPLGGQRHDATHANCPPGSHGQPRYATFGKALGHQRDDIPPARAKTGEMRHRRFTPQTSQR